MTDVYDENNPTIAKCPQCGGRRVKGTTPAKQLVDDNGSVLDGTNFKSVSEAMQWKSRQINVYRAALAQAIQAIDVWVDWGMPEEIEINGEMVESFDFLESLRAAENYSGDLESFWSIFNSVDDLGKEI